MVKYYLRTGRFCCCWGFDASFLKLAPNSLSFLLLKKAGNFIRLNDSVNSERNFAGYKSVKIKVLSFILSIFKRMSTCAKAFACYVSYIYDST